MNERLAEPILLSISTNWEKVFVASLPDLLSNLSESVGDSCSKFHATLGEHLTGSGSCDPERIAAIQKPLLAGRFN
eukprot:SAG31_NODE_7083_length_1793_cov_2.665880_2_plen_76_part_00